MSIFQTIRGRYTLVFGGLAIVFLIVVVCAEALVSYLQNNLGKYEHGEAIVENGDRHLYQSRSALATLILVQETKDGSTLETEILSHAQLAHDRMQTFRKLIVDIPEINDYLANFDTVYKTWEASNLNILTLTKKDYHDGMNLFVGQNQTDFTALRNLYHHSEELITKYAAKDKKGIDEITETFKLDVGILASFVVVLSIALAWFAPRSISRAIKLVTSGVHEISTGDGDLTRRINSPKKDETGDLSREFDGFVAKLGGLIGQVRDGCEHVRQEMFNLGKSATESAELSDRQHQSLDFVVSAVEEMGGATREVAQNAAHTVSEVESLSNSANNGVKQLDSAIAQLDSLSDQIQSAASVISELSERSDKIASVLDVILGISEQTNLLALNAAIEAARAGEQGRGFAVVADEVRGLASQTQASAEDIKVMINNLQSGVSNAVSVITKSVEMTTTSVTLSHNTKESIAVVQQSADRIYDFTTQTASATEEQSKVTDEINENLSSLSTMSKEVLEISKRISHSVNETLSNSDELAGQVKRFTV
ncbi:methyl-accepting chemotaxis protein [Marinomonas colpomeniae]|uniref:Methyl-accepting chemotaxis protein n=1 Tax=Marinomonas colpomeniae TaxID=2774408 RepID=A0ABR8NXS3_9GAMM|nr:methyl-accepting chemotaxis protein [Marinomonas colpomeniae]MBD5770850.1 methyl-accepting chemotaxis protein [Marinomonas colpomeniae]